MTTRLIGRSLSFASAGLLLAALAAGAAELPRVRLVATGGTISNRAGGRLTADDLVKSIPNLDRYVRAEAEQFANTSSSALTLEQWLQLARRINELYRSRRRTWPASSSRAAPTRSRSWPTSSTSP